MTSRNFGVKYRKKFLLDNEITNDLKSIYSEIGKNTFLSLMLIMCIFSWVLNQYNFRQGCCKLSKVLYQGKSLKNTMRLRNRYVMMKFELRAVTY